MRVVTLFLVAILTSAVETSQVAPADNFDAWDITDRGGTRLTYLNRPSLFLQNGVALSPAAGFADGTLDVDVAVHGHAGFAGIVFRAASADDYELVYLRTHRSRQWDALQYTPVFNGNEGWQLYTGNGFNAAAEIPANRWVHLRIVIDGVTAKVFVDDAAVPQLTITDLKRPWSRGRVGLWGRSGAASFSNFKATPVDRATPAPRPVTRAPGTIARWTISQPLSAATAEGLPEKIEWESVSSESTGLLNIGQYRKLLATRPGTNGDARTTVLARAVLRADRRRSVKMTFGYSDEVTVYLDGARIFTGKAAYLSRDGSYLGTVTLDDALYLNLEAGRHELVFAVTEAFGGWGVTARFDPTDVLVIE